MESTERAPSLSGSRHSISRNAVPSRSLSSAGGAHASIQADSESLLAFGTGSGEYYEGGSTPGSDETRILVADENHGFSKDEKTPLPEGWPSQPQEPAPKGSSRWRDIILDTVMMLGALPFFALAIVVAKYHHRAVDSTSLEWFQNITKIAGTMFPIFFAAIMGRAARKAASWHLERGTTIGFLEQLMGSQTIFSTITTQMSLRSFNVLAISLSLIWIFSPLGGQAALRIMSTDYIILSSAHNIIYFDTDSQPNFSSDLITDTTTDETVTEWFQQLDGLFIGSVLASLDVKNGNADQWGNVKIPLLSSYANSSQDWVATPNTTEGFEYVSLVGIPVTSSLPGNTTFSVESTYMELDCSKMVDGAIAPLSIKGVDLTARHYGGDWTQPPNGTFYGYNATITVSTSFADPFAAWSIGLDMFVSDLYNAMNISAPPVAYPGYFANTSDIKMEQGTLLFQSIDDLGEYVNERKNSTKTRCKVSEVYVESQILCQTSSTITTTRSCSVTAQRLSQKTHTQSNITFLSWPENFAWLSEQMPRAFGIEGLAGTSDPSVYYLNNTDPSFITTASGAPQIINIPPRQISIRLSQLLNTYLNLGQIGFGVTEGTVFEAIGKNISTTATTKNLSEVFVVSWFPWFTIYIIATSHMLISGVVSMIYSRLTLNPPVLGFVSSSIRDSRYVDLPPGGGTLEGMELSRHVKEMRVRMGGIRDNQTLLAGGEGDGEGKRKVGEKGGVKYTQTLLAGGEGEGEGGEEEKEGGEKGRVRILAIAREEDVLRTRRHGMYL